METNLPLPTTFTRGALASVGFRGWRTWQQLRAGQLQEVPAAPAAYVVYRPSAAPAEFTPHSLGGHFKGQDPTVAPETLHHNWVEGCEVVYIGKADHARRRLTQFAKFGDGHPIGHWGGRFIWQLKDSAELLVAWHPVTWPETAREYEKRLLARFSELHDGRRPFANLTG